MAEREKIEVMEEGERSRSTTDGRGRSGSEPRSATAEQEAPVHSPRAEREPVRERVEEKPGIFERKPWLKSLIWIIAIVLLLGAFLYWWHARKWADTDDAQVAGHIANISARVSGHISKIYVDDNQFVKAGTVLAEIDPSDYQIAVERAQADLANAQAEAGAARSNLPLAQTGAQTQIASAAADVTNASASIAAAEKGAEAARAQLAQAEANAARANQDVQRYQQLVAKQEIAQQLFDTAVANAKSANAAVDAARANVAAAEQQVAVARGHQLQAEAALSNAKAQPANVRVSTQRAEAASAAVERAAAALNQAQLNLQYTKIIAPVDGTVGKRGVEVGQNVQPGQQLMAVVPTNDLWVTANFKETQLRNMKPGQYASVHVDALDRDYDCRVDSIGAATGATFSMLPPENATGNYVKVIQRIPVKIVCDKTDGMRPGMSVEPDVKVR